MHKLIFFALPALSGCAALVSAAGVGWSGDVLTVEPGGVYAADLADGRVIDLGWAESSQIACFPATENLNFSGNHVFFGLKHPGNTLLTLAVTPAPGLDISLYALQLPGDVYETPPNLTDVLNCDDAYDYTFDSNPGELEYIETAGYGEDVNVLLGVAGANGVTAGSFEVELWTEAMN